MNGFEIPSWINNTQGAIEYKLGRRFYFSVALSLATLIATWIFYSTIGKGIV